MSDTIGPYHPSAPQQAIPPLPEHIPDPDEDHPSEQDVLPAVNGTCPVVLGCAVFGYGIYTAKSDVEGEMPVHVLRYALRAGITAFDTSPWYHPSEIILGRALERLGSEFPRDSYQIITKVGKYGPHVRHHTYDPDTVVASVNRSLTRLKTDHLDVVYLHDVEFVASHPHPCPAGAHLSALEALTSSTAPDEWGLRPPYEPRGQGDAQIIQGLRALSALRSKGIIKKIGIAGYPLPLLLRLSLLAKAQNITIDIVQTYAQQTILNPSLEAGYLSAFSNAGVHQVTNAAPLAMGILTSSGGPEWHPVNAQGGATQRACREASDLCKANETSIEAVSLGYGMRALKSPGGGIVPIVIGCKNIFEIKRTIEQWKQVNLGGLQSDKDKEIEEKVVRLFEQRGVRGVSWASPSPDAL